MATVPVHVVSNPRATLRTTALQGRIAGEMTVHTVLRCARCELNTGNHVHATRQMHVCMRYRIRGDIENHCLAVELYVQEG